MTKEETKSGVVTITVPFTYTAHVRPPRARNLKVEHFGSAVEASIPVVSSEDAPLVAEWMSSDQNEDRRVSSVARVFGGKFYVAQSQEGGAFKQALEMQFDDVYREPWNAYFGGDQPIKLFIEGKLPSIVDMAAIESTELETKKELVKESVAKCIVVDGILLKEGQVPVIDASLVQSTFSEALSIKVLTEAPAKIGRYQTYFDLSEYDAMLNWIEELCGDPEFQSLEVKQPMIRVHRPDLLPKRDHGTHSIKVAMMQEVSTFGSKLEHWPDIAIDAWKDLRRAARGLEPHCSHEQVAEALRIWKRFIESYDAMKEEELESRGVQWSGSTSPEKRRFTFLSARCVERDVDFNSKPLVQVWR